MTKPSRHPMYRSNKCNLCDGSGIREVPYPERPGCTMDVVCECAMGNFHVADIQDMAMAGVPMMFRGFTMERLMPRHATQLRAKEESIRLVGLIGRSPEPGKYGAVFAGKSGVGKTAVAAAAIHEALCATRNALFVTASEFIDNNRPERHYGPTPADANMAGLLVIDGLDSIRRSDWTDDIWWGIINHRYANGRPLIITCQDGLSKSVNESTMARINQMCSTICMA